MSSVTARVKFVDGLMFVAESESGHAIVLDGPKKHGGTELGMRPMELLLMGLGGCTGMDAISILRKKKQDVTAFELRLKGQRAENDPMRYTDIEIEYVVTGRGVQEDAVKRAVELSMQKYCSVKATLEGSAKVAYKYSIMEEPGR